MISLLPHSPQKYKSKPEVLIEKKVVNKISTKVTPDEPAFVELFWAEIPSNLKYFMSF